MIVMKIIQAIKKCLNTKNFKKLSPVEPVQESDRVKDQSIMGDDQNVKSKVLVAKVDNNNKMVVNNLEVENYDDDDEDYANDFLNDAALDNEEEKKQGKGGDNEDGSFEGAFLEDGELENQFVKDNERDKQLVKERQEKKIKGMEEDDDDEFDF